MSKSDGQNFRELCFIGGGNMALAIIRGLIASGYPGKHIQIVDPSESQREQAHAVCSDLVTHAAASDIDMRTEAVILAIKPQIMHGVCVNLASAFAAQSQTVPLVISIAAGIRTRDLERWLGESKGIVRVMPNQGAMVGLGSSGLYATKGTAQTDRELAASLMQAVGGAIWVESEELIDSVTAVSGSGPAYFFLMMEAMQAAAEQLGLDSAAAAQLVSETATGAAALAKRHGDPASLRRAVTSPGGTTEAAIKSLLADGFQQQFLTAMSKAKARATELADAAAQEG